MFHHFPDEPAVGDDCLVRSTDLTYSDEDDPADATGPVYTFLRAVTQSGYRRDGDGYRASAACRRSSSSTAGRSCRTRCTRSTPTASRTCPSAWTARRYQWVDLDGEGVPGILTEQAGAWFYKRNLSPVGERDGRARARWQRGRSRGRALAGLAGGRAQFMDLAGDGQPDLVRHGRAGAPGFYEHDDGEGWEPFRPFASLPRARPRATRTCGSSTSTATATPTC